jgi:hypothetical protein
LPAPFPQFVTYVDVFLGNLIALIVWQQTRLPETPRGALQLRCNDVPGDSALR